MINLIIAEGAFYGIVVLSAIAIVVSIVVDELKEKKKSQNKKEH